MALALRLGRRTAAQVGRPDRLDVEHSVRAHQGERRLVGKVGAPLPTHLLLPLLGALLGGFCATLAALLAKEKRCWACFSACSAVRSCRGWAPASPAAVRSNTV